MDTKQPTPTRPNPRDSTIRIEQIAVDPAEHAEFKDGLLAVARAGVADFPRLLETIRKQLRKSDPEGILASFASYGLQAHVTRDGVEKKAHPDILQHHAELLQAILLTIPADAWGTGVLTPQVMQTVFDTVPKLSQAFLFQRILDGQTVKDDPEALTIRSLQERIRLHTHGVRNWGYFSDVVRLSLDLYHPLDAAMLAHYGFNATDVIEVLNAVRCGIRAAAGRPLEHAEQSSTRLQCQADGAAILPARAGSYWQCRRNAQRHAQRHHPPAVHGHAHGPLRSPSGRDGHLQTC